MATREQLIEDFADHKLATGEKFVNLINSMKVVQEPVADPAASGTSLSFIDSIEQDRDGKITATKKTLDLANAHELNPFKGWYKTGDTLPTDGFDGAYLYFKDTSELTGQTTIYRWNGTTYADTGTVVDTSNVNTFETGQALNGTGIKDLDGNNDPNAAGVLSADAGKSLGEAINGKDEYGEPEMIDLTTLGRYDREFRYISDGDLTTVNAMVATANYSGDSESRYLNLKDHRGYLITIQGKTNTSGFTTHLTFITKGLSDYTRNLTLQQLVDAGILCESIHKNEDTGLWNPVVLVAGGDTFSVRVPDDAFSLYITKAHPANPNKVYPLPTSIQITPVTRVEGLNERVAGLEGRESEDEGSATNPVSLTNGAFGADGEIDKNARGYVTGYIPCGGFVFEVHDGWRIAEAVLYDDKLRMVNRYDRREDQTWLKALGFAGLLPQYYMRYKIVKVTVTGEEDETALYDGTDIVVKSYIPFSDGRLVSALPDGVSAAMYRAFMARVRASVNSTWISVRNMPNPVDQFKAGNLNRGIPYTECGEYSKFVGMHVAYKTFLTALKNPRSVMYTELVAGARALSKYGYLSKYHGTGESDNYYGFMGLVCTGLTSYVSGLNQVVAANVMNSLMGGYGFEVVASVSSSAVWRVGGEVVTPEAFFQSLQPMDLILQYGHCSVISEVKKNMEGETVSVVWTESTTPRSISSAYSEQGFIKSRIEPRLASGTPITGNIQWQVWRLTDPTKVALTEKVLFPEVDGNVSFMNMSVLDYAPESVEIDKDIATYAGEYAVMVINADGNDGTDGYNIYGGYLNCHRGGSLYDSLVIEKEINGGYDVVTVVSIAENGGAVAQSAILAEDAVGEKDWVVVDVNVALGESLSAGKYRAKLTGPDSAESGYCHWLMVEIGLQYSDGVASFGNVSGGVPYMVRREDIKGATSYIYENIAPGETSKAIGRSSFGNNDYVKLFVRTDYGVGVKRVNVGSN